MDEFFFCVCPCSSIEWIEYSSYTLKKKMKIEKDRINHLTKEGKQQYPWKINKKESKEGFICNECENILYPIPFSEVDIKQRIKVFHMTQEERIAFVNSYNMVKVLEKNQEANNTHA